MFHDIDGNFMSNNDERIIFYCKGVIETVRKLGWAPDIIHCQGWFASLVPMYIKNYILKIHYLKMLRLYILYLKIHLRGLLSNNITDKTLFENLDKKDVARLIKPTIGNLHKFAIDYSDAIVQASPNINNSVIDYVKSTGKDFLEYPGADNYINAYEELYDKI